LFVKSKIIPDQTELKALAKKFRKDITIKKILLWKELRNRQMLKKPTPGPSSGGEPAHVQSPITPIGRQIFQSNSRSFQIYVSNL